MMAHAPGKSASEQALAVLGIPAVVTAASLANKLGLSRSTVSIVLRGDAVSRKNSPATIERVRDAARKHDYVPNQIAQSLRRQKSGIVSIVVVNFRLDWCEELLTGALDVLDQAGCTPFLAAHRNSSDRQEKELLAALRRRDPAGLNDRRSRPLSALVSHG